MLLTRIKIAIVLTALAGIGVGQAAKAADRETQVTNLLRSDVQQSLGLGARQKSQIKQIVTKCDKDILEVLSCRVNATDNQRRFVIGKLIGRRDSRLLKVLNNRQRRQLASEAASDGGRPVPGVLLWHDPRRIDFIQRVA